MFRLEISDLRGIALVVFPGRRGLFPEAFFFNCLLVMSTELPFPLTACYRLGNGRSAKPGSEGFGLKKKRMQTDMLCSTSTILANCRGVGSSSNRLGVGRGGVIKTRRLEEHYIYTGGNGREEGRKTRARTHCPVRPAW